MFQPTLPRASSRFRPSVVGLCLASPFLSGGGCLPESSTPVPAASAKVITPSTTATQTGGVLTLSGAETFEVEVPANTVLRVAIGADVDGGTLDLAFLQAPDGTRFTSSDGLTSRGGVTFTRAEGPTDDAGRSRIRFDAACTQAGKWRFSIVRAQTPDLKALLRNTRERSIIENTLLWAYLNDASLASSAQLARFLDAVYPALASANRRIDYLVRVSVGAPEAQAPDVAVPDSFSGSSGLPDGDASGDGAPNPGDGSNANDNAPGSGGNDNSSAGNANDNSGNDNSGGDNTNDNSAGNDNSGGDNTNDNSAGNDNSTNDNSGGDNANDNSAGNDNSGSDNSNDNSGGGNATPNSVALQSIARTGDHPPGQPDAAKFTAFGDPIIDQAGRIAFFGIYSGGSGNVGLYVWQNGSLQRIIDDDPNRTGTVPGRGPSDSFGDLKAQQLARYPIAWADAGRLLFTAPSRGSSQIMGIYRWRASDGDLLRVVDSNLLVGQFNDVQSGNNGPIFTAEFFQPGVSDNAIAVFVASYSYVTKSGGFGLGTGLYTSNGVSISAIADERLSPAGDVPDQPAAAKWGRFDALPTLNPAGEFLFQAAYKSGNGDQGVYLLSGDNLVRVLDNASGRSFPGLTPGALVGAAGEPYPAFAIGSNGHIAVAAPLTVGGNTHDAVLLFNNSQWREISAPDGTPADALLSGVNADGQCIVRAADRPRLVSAVGTQDLAAIPPPQLNGRTVTWGLTGAALNDNGRALITFGSDSAGDSVDSGLAFWTGLQLLLVADARSGLPNNATFQVVSVTLPELDRTNRSGILNNRDEITFRTRETGPDGQPGTADDVQVLYYGRAVP